MYPISGDKVGGVAQPGKVFYNENVPPRTFGLVSHKGKENIPK